MGIETMLLLAVSTAGTIAQSVQARKAAKAQKEARAISTAGGEIKDRAARRRALREERIRRARLVQASESSGTEGSSGELGAVSSLSANRQSAVANQSAQGLVAQGISAANQRAADAQTRFNQIGAFTDLVGKGLEIWGDSKTGAT